MTWSGWLGAVGVVVTYGVLFCMVAQGAGQGLVGLVGASAVRTMYRELDGVPRPPVPPVCPFTLAELLASPPDGGQPEA